MFKENILFYFEYLYGKIAVTRLLNHSVDSDIKPTSL